MLDNLRESIHQYKLKQKLLANNAKLKIGKNSDLRHPEYVHCSGVVTLGDNCKLYCWDSYQSNVFDYKPQILMGGCSCNKNSHHTMRSQYYFKKRRITCFECFHYGL